MYDSSSYLTADPKVLHAAAERAAEASRQANAVAASEDMEESDSEEDDDDEDEGDEEMPEAGPSTTREAPAEATEAVNEEATVEEAQPPIAAGPPRIMITTSPSPCKETYAFCEDLKGIFPGGEFFKRPKGRGFELGRISRWAAKRQYNALLVVNEDHKTPSELYMVYRGIDSYNTDAITLINLPAGPTAYFKLTSIQLGKTIYVCPYCIKS